MNLEHKAITLWQPWASLWVAGIKKNETRSWATSHRGPLVVHAAKLDSVQLLDRIGYDAMEALEEVIASHWRLLYPISVPNHAGYRAPTMECLPRGCIIGVVDIIACLPIVSSPYIEHDGLPFLQHENGPATGVKRLEQALGDYTPGRYAWVAAGHTAYHEPIPWRGAQGLWRVPDEVLP